MKSLHEWREDKFAESQPPEKKNKEGGYEPQPDQKSKWKKADLITLPTNVSGTNCGNCRFMAKKGNDIGFCTFTEVLEFVTPRMCCKWWDNEKVKRSWE